MVLQAPFVAGQVKEDLRVFRVGIDASREVQNFLADTADAEHVVADTADGVGRIRLHTRQSDDAAEAAEAQANPGIETSLAMKPVNGLIAMASYENRVGHASGAQRIVAGGIVPARDTAVVELPDEIDGAGILFVKRERAELGADCSGRERTGGTG